MADPKVIIVPRAMRGGTVFPPAPPPASPPPPPPPPPSIGDYPKIWAFRIGSRNYTEDNLDGEQEREHLAKFNGLTLGMYDNGPWDNGSSGYLSRLEVGADLKSRSSACTLFDYMNVMETGLTGPNGQYLDSQVGPGGSDWWTYRDVDLGFADSNKVSTYPGSYNTNITSFTIPDVNGDRYPEYYAKTKIANKLNPHLASGGIGVGPSGMNPYLDVMDIRLRQNQTDLNGDGELDYARSYYDAEIGSHMVGPLDQGGTPTQAYGLAVSIAAAWRQGQMDCLDEIVSTFPDVYLLANIVTWSRETQTLTPTFNLPIEYRNRIHGGIVEGMTQEAGFPFTGILHNGTPKPGDTFGSWMRGYAMYYTTMGYCIAPQFVQNDYHLDPDPEFINSVVTGTDRTLQNNRINVRVPLPGSNTPWHVMRWGLCTTLLHNGYYNNNVVQGFSGASHYDEFGTCNEGTTGLFPGYLGQPVDAPVTGPDASGLWSREFDNGWTVVNPNETGSITCPVSTFGGAGNAIRINGAQDPSWNDGSVINTSFSIPPIDGIIVLRNV